MTRVMTFYCFTRLQDLAVMRQHLHADAAALALKGTILLAEEGINGTLSGDERALETFAGKLGAIDGLADMPIKFSAAHADNPVFYRLKVRIKPEIVALGQPQARPAERTGVHVDAAAWNALLDDPDVLVIDTRNDYEIGIGTFPGAVNPGTVSFRQFPDFVAGLDPEARPRIAMFCTGGIRCEKASAYMLDQGFAEVYQLDGGILRYLETVPDDENRWQGECFVFDQRVSVDAELNEGTHRQCFACRRPLTPEEVASPDYVVGVSCPNCIDEQTETQRAGFAERQRQVSLAAGRGEMHVGRRMPVADQGASRGSR